MRWASEAAIAFGEQEHARLGYPSTPEEFARGLGVRLIVGSDNFASNGPPSVVSQTPDRYAPRQRFTIFHELAHVLTQRGDFEADIMAEVDDDDAEDHLEAVVNHMAGLFLIPAPLVQQTIMTFGFTPQAILQLRREAGASLAATSRRMLAYERDIPRTIFLSGETYVLDVASSSPWNRIRRYDRLPDPQIKFPEAQLATIKLPSSGRKTLGIIDYR